MHRPLCNLPTPPNIIDPFSALYCLKQTTAIPIEGTQQASHGDISLCNWLTVKVPIGVTNVSHIDRCSQTIHPIHEL